MKKNVVKLSDYLLHSMLSSPERRIDIPEKVRNRKLGFQAEKLDLTIKGIELETKREMRGRKDR